MAKKIEELPYEVEPEVYDHYSEKRMHRGKVKPKRHTLTATKRPKQKLTVYNYDQQGDY